MSFYSHMEFRAILGLLKLTFEGVLAWTWEVSWCRDEPGSSGVSDRITFYSKVLCRVRVMVVSL